MCSTLKAVIITIQEVSVHYPIFFKSLVGIANKVLFVAHLLTISVTRVILHHINESNTPLNKLIKIIIYAPVQ